MMAPGFKPVGWVAAVAVAAIGSYMLSLNVASERADLLKIERQIISTKQAIRTLQTELGTRGRLAQLEQWNADVLALSAPTTTQFLESEVKLARFDQTGPTLDQRAEVRMASAEVASPTPRAIEAPVLQASAPAATAPPAAPALANGGANGSLVQRASLTMATPKPRKASLDVAVAKPLAAAVVTPPAKPKAASAEAKLKPNGIAAGSVKPKPAKPTTLALANVKPVKPAKRDTPTTKAAKPVRPASRIDAGLVAEIGVAARRESGRGGR